MEEEEDVNWWQVGLGVLAFFALNNRSATASPCAEEREGVYQASSTNNEASYGVSNLGSGSAFSSRTTPTSPTPTPAPTPTPTLPRHPSMKQVGILGKAKYNPAEHDVFMDISSNLTYLCVTAKPCNPPLYRSLQSLVEAENRAITGLAIALAKSGMGNGIIRVTSPAPVFEQRHYEVNAMWDDLERYLLSGRRYSGLIFARIACAYTYVYCARQIANANPHPGFQGLAAELRDNAKRTIDFMNHSIDDRDYRRVRTPELLDMLLNLPITTDPSRHVLHELLRELSSPLTIAYASTKSGGRGDGSTARRTGEERRDLAHILWSTPLPESLSIIDLPSCRIRDINAHLSRINSVHVFHYSGGGAPGGLYFENDNGDSRLVGPEALGELLAGYNVQLAVLNTSHAVDHGQVIANHIQYSVAMDLTIDVEASTAFGRSLYESLGAGNDIEYAFRLARAGVRCDYPGCDPKLFVRGGGVV